jgi:hypothetical protein
MTSKIKPRLITTEKYPEADKISGKYYEKYDTVLYNFLTNIVELYPYIVISYPYVFTGSHNISWISNTNINKYITLKYTPAVPKFFYTYNEIYEKYLVKYQHLHNHTNKFKSILNIGLEHGFIELLNYLKLLKPDTNINFIGKLNSTNAFENYIKTDSVLSTYKNINYDATLNNNLYDLLLTSYKVDTIIFNYNTGISGFNFNFAFSQTIGNFVSMLLALKSLTKGGIFICHIYAIINKSNADVFVILKQYFDTADLYFPECANSYFSSGTWAIFTGFKGIPDDELQNLFQILDHIKTIYPNGLNDVNIYDEYIRKKCWVVKAINNDLPHIYINGYLEYVDTQPVYDYIREFNEKAYLRKFIFARDIYNLYRTSTEAKKYPNTYLLPTYEQSLASIKYLKKWKFEFSVSNILGTEPRLKDLFYKSIFENPQLLKSAKVYTYLVKTDYLNMKMIDAEFTKRGNWVKYNPKIHKRLDFFYIDGLHIADESLYNTKSVLKNIIGDARKNITVKYNLYDNLITIPGAESFLPKTIKFDIKDKPLSYLNTFKTYFKNGRPMICKIGTMGEGLNIITTNKFEEFYKFMEHFYDVLRKHPNKQFNKWILQEYIDNPYLIDKRKFHVRLHLIYQPGDKPSYYIHNSYLALADEPYKHGDWENKAIHDTHFHGRHGISWPDDFYVSTEQKNHIYKQYDFICSCIVNSIGGQCYEDAANCFQMFGLDLMITDDLTVKLIEVNGKIGIKYHLAYQTKLFQGILKLVVDEYFPPLNTQIMPGNFFLIPKLDVLLTHMGRKNTLKKTKSIQAANNTKKTNARDSNKK